MTRRDSSTCRAAPGRGRRGRERRARRGGARRRASEEAPAAATCCGRELGESARARASARERRAPAGATSALRPFTRLHAVRHLARFLSSTKKTVAQRAAGEPRRGAGAPTPAAHCVRSWTSRGRTRCGRQRKVDLCSTDSRCPTVLRPLPLPSFDRFSSQSTGDRRCPSVRDFYAFIAILWTTSLQLLQHQRRVLGQQARRRPRRL